MRIDIPTKGRLNNQLTMTNLPLELRAKTTIVCPSNEAFWLRQRYTTHLPDNGPEVIVQPNDSMGIAEKRHWIIDSAFDRNVDKIVMLDDDLRFAVRRDDLRDRFRKAEKQDILDAFQQLEEILSPEVPHAGFSARGSGIGESAQMGGWQEGKRMMYVLGYHIPTVKTQAIFGRISTHEDMDVCLQLLRKGFPNKVNFDFVVDQKFGNPGGCTSERTVLQNNADALELAVLHPGYVRVTEKAYATSVPRIEVVCSWQKAMKDGLLVRK